MKKKKKFLNTFLIFYEKLSNLTKIVTFSNKILIFDDDQRRFVTQS
jgi:hypothetical protein